MGIMLYVGNEGVLSPQDVEAYEASLPPAELVGKLSSVLAEASEAERAAFRSASASARAEGRSEEERQEDVARALAAVREKYRPAIEAARAALDAWERTPEGRAALVTQQALYERHGVIVCCPRRRAV